jgi:NAD(P)-dependent dehydrogenase (short-subunit alcohol dehydrogenase family)
MDSLSGRVALITGAGRGIGRAEAHYFAAEGAKVVVNDPGVGPDGSGGDASIAAAVAGEIVAAGGEAVASTDSVADWDGARRIVETALDAFGDLHVVVNNAGIVRNRPLTELTEADLDELLAVKLKGTVAVSHHAARYWRDRSAATSATKPAPPEDRAIINTSSASGLQLPLPTQTNYAAANAGVAAATIVSALELSALGVRVNCIAPSMARTRLTADVPGMSGSPANENENELDQQHPRWIAPVAAYLATAGCPYTGQVISVRGGSVVLNRTWSPTARVTKPDDNLWTVDELATAMADLPREDIFETFSQAIGAALGVDGSEAVSRLLQSPA